MFIALNKISKQPLECKTKLKTLVIALFTRLHVSISCEQGSL